MTDPELTETITNAITHRAANHIWATEVPVGKRRIDVWTLHPFRSQGHLATSYEVKVSRSDWRRDTALKQREARLYSDRLYYVTPKGLIKPEELPDWAGLQEWNGTRLVTKVQAPDVAKAVLSWDFIVGLLRSSGTVRRDVSVQMQEMQREIYRKDRLIAQLQKQVKNS